MEEAEAWRSEPSRPAPGQPPPGLRGLLRAPGGSHLCWRIPKFRGFRSPPPATCTHPSQVISHFYFEQQNLVHSALGRWKFRRKKSRLRRGALGGAGGREVPSQAQPARLALCPGHLPRALFPTQGLCKTQSDKHCPEWGLASCCPWPRPPAPWAGVPAPATVSGFPRERGSGRRRASQRPFQACAVLPDH